MITTLDRMVLVAFFRSYAIVWSSLISLFVVIDLFTHLDAYMNRPGGFIAIAHYILRYYAYRMPQVFDLLAEPISLMAATFTVADLLGSCARPTDHHIRALTCTCSS